MFLKQIFAGEAKLRGQIHMNTAVSRKVVLQTGKTLRDNVSRKLLWVMVVLRLLERTSRCFSVVEGNNTNTCIRSFSFSFLVAESP